MDVNFILLILFLGQWCLSVLLFAVLKNAGLNVLLSRVAYKIACLPEYFNFADRCFQYIQMGNTFI